MVEMTELVPVQTRLERETAEALEALAQSNERSVAAEVRLAIRGWLAVHPPPQETAGS
jgi:hypothetical protein